MSNGPPIDDTVARDAVPSAAGGARFVPGLLVAGRYRIVAILGRGGMGEVYRAEDVKLGHAVALKFLPRHAAADPKTLERLFREVRIGRQLSHPNLCRLYDIGESDEGHFITMEYVDGEDLGSLLRRIGRLPPDKAIEIARELGAGLAAAHDSGIVHRDLKPANVMIDGRGHVRITDFGLAALADDAAAGGGIAGTPAYMAPEQLSGGKVTACSDIYSLGLIFHEIFTGNRLRRGASLAEVLSERRVTPTSIRGIDPAVERVILRCLDEKPPARPSAQAVIASLPGGDPLTAAIAAGETPSPAMVAAAGAAGDLTPAVAWATAITAIGGMLLVAALSGRTNVLRLVPLPKSPDVLDARAADIAEHFGYTDSPATIGHDWIYDFGFVQWMTKRKGVADGWRSLSTIRPGAVQFTFRSGTRQLVPQAEPYRIAIHDPPLVEPGMIFVGTDPQGRLMEFAAVPPSRIEAPLRAATDWSIGFREAAIDPARFHPVPPLWSAPVASDERRAWEGTLPGQEDVVLRIEAAARAGRVDWFIVIGPWTEPPLLREKPRGFGERLAAWARVLFDVATIVPAIILAVRNLRRGRGDRRAAFRVAMLCFVLMAVAILVRGAYAGSVSREWNVVIMNALGRAALLAMRVWIVYIALEPYVRRNWPRTLIGWARLVGGRVRDPMVGRDVLVGTIGGLVMVTVLDLSRIIPPWFGMAVQPLQFSTLPFSYSRYVFVYLFGNVAYSILYAVQAVFITVLFRALTKRPAVAAALAFLLASAMSLGDSGIPLLVSLAVATCSAAVLLAVMVWRGLLALVACITAWQCTQAVSLTLDPSDWYFGRAAMLIAIVIAIVLAAFAISLGGKPLFGRALFDDQ
ncbi:MAG TPA: serine/threonine-protein kinase [Thermoanaerobaculia bacterium]|jgi:serine/threonine-protein kinase|nr:serine/threonine-protein kinase [Thermoanaerobaculia bacterium]